VVVCNTKVKKPNSSCHIKKNKNPRGGDALLHMALVHPPCLRKMGFYPPGQARNQRQGDSTNAFLCWGANLQIGGSVTDGENSWPSKEGGEKKKSGEKKRSDPLGEFCAHEGRE